MEARWARGRLDCHRHPYLDHWPLFTQHTPTSCSGHSLTDELSSLNRLPPLRLVPVVARLGPTVLYVHSSC